MGVRFIEELYIDTSTPRTCQEPSHSLKKFSQSSAANEKRGSMAPFDQLSGDCLGHVCRCLSLSVCRCLSLSGSCLAVVWCQTIPAITVLPWTILSLASVYGV